MGPGRAVVPTCHPSSLNGPARTFLGTSIPSYENKGEPTCVICACRAEQLLLAVACPPQPGNSQRETERKPGKG